jgi:hypothetical protein
MTKKISPKPKTEGYYKDDQTEMCLLASHSPVGGQERFLGGEVGNNGKI